MNKQKRERSVTTDGNPPVAGYENAPAPAPIDPVTNQHRAYWVLSEEERKRGFVRFEPYPESASSVIGRFWTQEQLDGVEHGCGAVTTMGQALCETYARDPSYYDSTFCIGCHTLLPVNEFRWVEDGAVVGT